MDQHHLATLLDSAPRTKPDGDRLLVRLVRPAWPGGIPDKSQPPAALDWLRRWGAPKPQPVVLDCTCDHGRCRLCN